MLINIDTRSFWKYAESLQEDISLEDIFASWISMKDVSIREATALWFGINSEIQNIYQFTQRIADYQSNGLARFTVSEEHDGAYIEIYSAYISISELRHSLVVTVIRSVIDPEFEKRVNRAITQYLEYTVFAPEQLEKKIVEEDIIDKLQIALDSDDFVVLIGTLFAKICDPKIQSIQLYAELKDRAYGGKVIATGIEILHRKSEFDPFIKYDTVIDRNQRNDQNSFEEIGFK